MIVTEAEAATKWCPFARSMREGRNRANSLHKAHATGKDAEYFEQQEADCCCIGSRCMAWRDRYPDQDRTDGFCGLAYSVRLP